MTSYTKLQQTTKITFVIRHKSGKAKKVPVVHLTKHNNIQIQSQSYTKIGAEGQQCLDTMTCKISWLISESCVLTHKSPICPFSYLRRENKQLVSEFGRTATAGGRMVSPHGGSAFTHTKRKRVQT